jgi:hypothetical protein
MRTLLVACNLLAFACLLSALPSAKNGNLELVKQRVLRERACGLRLAKFGLRGGGDYSPDPEEDDFANAQTMIHAAAVGDLVTLRSKLESGVNVNTCDYDRYENDLASNYMLKVHSSEG